MTSRTLIMAACVAALAAGCQAKKVNTTAKADRETAATEEKKEAETLGTYAGETGEDVAEATRDAADDTLRETDRAEEKVLGENETLPPEPGVDMPATAEEADEDMVAEDEKAPGDIVAEKPEVDFGTQVAARVERVDQKQSHVVFTITDDKNEIALQSGKEIKVSFGDLRLLTGMEKDKAIEALQSAGDLKVRVLGVGDAMRIVEIDLPDADEKEPVKGMEEKTY